MHTTNTAITAPAMLQNSGGAQSFNLAPLGNLTQMDIGNLSVAQIADKLEKQRINELKNAALGMKGNLVQNGRCPKCTLKPPCKHYEKAEDIPSSNAAP